MRRSTVVFALVIILLAASAVICGEKNKDEDKVTETEKTKPEMITTGSGLRYVELKVGEGKKADNGMNVSVNYTVWLDVKGERGRKIDSSLDPNRTPLPFEVGVRNLIAGWNEGMLGMQVGGTRVLYVPWALGYGEAGRPPAIPGKSNLIFEIELLEIK